MSTPLYFLAVILLNQALSTELVMAGWVGLSLILVWRVLWP